MSDTIQYWINQNGIQTGPHTFIELQQMEITPAAYVWRAGMDDWKPITAIPELVSLYTHQAQAEAQPEATLSEPVTDSHEPVAGLPEVPTGEPEVAPAPAFTPPTAQQATSQQPAALPEEAMPQPECPPTNLVWAILSTILCCLPLGVVAIIYSTKVSQKYRQGDIKAAQHYSEVSAWWCIGTIIGGIVLSPFVSLIQMAIMG